MATRKKRRTTTTRKRKQATKTVKLSKKLQDELKTLRALRKKKYKLEIGGMMIKEIVAMGAIAFVVVTYLSMQGRAGIVGEYWHQFLSYIMGYYGEMFFMVVFSALALTFFFSKQIKFNFTRVVGLIFLFASVLGFIHLSDSMQGDALSRVQEFGGVFGFISSFLLRTLFGEVAAKVILAIVFVISLLITFDITIREIFEGLKEVRIAERVEKKEPQVRRTTRPKTTKAKADVEAEDKQTKLNIVKPDFITSKVEGEEKKATKTKKAAKADIKPAVNVSGPIEIKKKEDNMMKTELTPGIDWKYPGVDLLENSSSKIVIDDKELQEKAEVIREKFGQFNLEVTMRDVNVGPTVIQYTLQPSEGIKLSKITNLRDDIKLALAAKSLRIQAPIPGKSVVGIELASEHRATVRLRELLESNEFHKVKSNLRLPLGRDVSGEVIVGDLADMPHLLIAGATGAGKSVGTNTFLISLLYQNSPYNLRLILVDPKQVELSMYNGIPHLLTPVITDPDKALSALRWCVSEMNRRNKEFSRVGARNLKEYNVKMKAKNEQTMPNIVILIDELADLMMSGNKKEVEQSINRIAQMARAAGMHLILATQRPSVDVITGLIKANIPTRIAYTVTSGIDSRTILGKYGAEDLLGKGDMLYAPKGLSDPLRVQGVFIASEEIERVVNNIKVNSAGIEMEYDEEIVSSGPANAVGSILAGGDDSDELVVPALEFIRENHKASASMLQRRLSVGYARAARILDILEAQGFIGPSKGAKPRDIHIEVIEEALSAG